MPRPRTSPDHELRLTRIVFNVSPSELIEVDTARGPKPRSAFARESTLDIARAGVRSAKEDPK